MTQQAIIIIQGRSGARVRYNANVKRAPLKRRKTIYNALRQPYVATDYMIAFAGLDTYYRVYENYNTAADLSAYRVKVKGQLHPVVVGEHMGELSECVG